jgi:hypothetical protein
MANAGSLGGGEDMTIRQSWIQHSELYVTEAELPPRFIRWLGHQRWIPRGQDRVLRLLLDPVGFWGQKYRGDLAHFIDWLVFCYGGQAMSELTVLRECVKAIRSRKPRPVLFLDIGANAGHHTLFMAGMVDQVIAFEPYPPLQALITDKIALNNLRNVSVMPFGLGDKDDVLDYYPSETKNSGTGTFSPGDEVRHAGPAKLQIKKWGFFT